MSEKLIVTGPNNFRMSFPNAEAFVVWLKHAPHDASTLSLFKVADCHLKAVA